MSRKRPNRQPRDGDRLHNALVVALAEGPSSLARLSKRLHRHATTIKLALEELVREGTVRATRTPRGLVWSLARRLGISPRTPRPHRILRMNADSRADRKKPVLLDLDHAAYRAFVEAQAKLVRVALVEIGLDAADATAIWDSWERTRPATVSDFVTWMDRVVLSGDPVRAATVDVELASRRVPSSCAREIN